MKTLAVLQKITIVLTIVLAVFLIAIVGIALSKRAKAPKTTPAGPAVVIKPPAPVPSRPVQPVPGGGDIKLVGISADGLSPRRWWSISGRLLHRLPVDDPSVPTKLNSVDGAIYRTVFVARNLPANASFSFDVPDAPATSWSIHGSKDGPVIFSIDAVIPSVFVSINERVGVDGGDWMTLASHRVEPGDSGGTAYGVRPELGSYVVAISPVTELSGHAAFTVQSSENAAIDSRIVVVDSTGHVIVGKVVNSEVRTNGASTSIKQNVVFSSIPTKDVHLIEVQFRVFHFVEFDNLPLEPLKTALAEKDDQTSENTSSVRNSGAFGNQPTDAPLAPVGTPQSLLATPAQWGKWLGPQNNTAAHQPQ